ncbi:uncharacterized protein F54H12.2-like [Patiria miniata]|uniref:Uncharacterized protein n=1 Tax=Patiria miniata TaxID=46514 RepID=A0A914A5S7_PATMI|nr:uncharacterized protein F54H12.2-like [Patiria miniata]
MSLLHSNSCECTKSELDIFTIPPTQTSIEKAQWEEFHPISTISDGGPIEFFVPGSGEEYMDLNQTQLYVRAKITKADGSNLTAADHVGPVNLFLQSLFSQIDVSLNERLISPSTPTYPYLAILETLLSYGSDAMKSQLTTALFYKDTAGKMDSADPQAADDAANQGLKKRYEFTKNSRVVDMMGPIHSDIFFQDKHMLNGVDLKLKLIRSSETFCLMASGANPAYKVVILNASVFVRKVKVSSAVMLGHMKALERGTAKYPIKRNLCKMVSVPRGNLTLTQDHVFLGQLPNRIVVGCVTNQAFNGQYSKNPFNFQHMNINFLTVHVDGEQIPYSPLKPKFEGANKNYIRSYQTLFSGTDKMYQDEGNIITRDSYPAGYTLFVFDLSPDLSVGGHFNLVKRGNLRLDLHFGTPLEATINVIIYAEFNNIIEIDQARNVIFDYSS